MSFCTNCGAGLGLGRFCTNCGAPVAVPDQPASNVSGDPWAATDGLAAPVAPTEETPAERTQLRMPAVQPDAATGTRYPLFADELPPTSSPEPEVGQDIPMWVPPTATPSTALGDAAPPEDPRARRDRAGRGRVGWIVAVVLLLILCSVGVAWMVNRGAGEDDVAGRDSSQSEGEGEGGQDGTSDPKGDDAGSDQKSPKRAGGRPVDLATSASASGPAPAPPSTDFDGNRFSYPASNMLDDDPESAYRVNGDATGTTITFDLGEEATVSEVGLINGFAKSGTKPNGKTLDWYEKNRRILEVEWIFDDGQSVTQSLGETTDLQTISVEDAVTRTIKLRLTEVSTPGKGKWGKDVTSISSVLMRGSAS